MMANKMKETIFPFNPQREFFTPEGCYILELSNSAADPAASIARARVTPGITTRRHRVRETVERYIILEGKGLVEVGSLPPQEVNPGDVVLIPPGCRQRITNTGGEDLIFLCLCTPRFIPEAYEDLESDPKGNRDPA
jgi:mannose-6-phosphate isomerase-like protein (cupin superfamily)